VLGAEYGFLGVIRFAVAPDRPRDLKKAEARLSSWRDEHGYRGPETLEGGVAEVRNALHEIHRRVLRELGDLSDAEVDGLALYWDGPKPIRFRLHRFEAHMIQHTVQVDKTLVWIDRAPTEARRLVRVLYRDLAAVEMLTSSSFGQGERDEVAKTIDDRASEIGAV
jgi:hypothetical protein